MTQTKAQAPVMSPYDHHWQQYEKLDFHFAGYQNLDHSHAVLPQNLDYHGYTQPSNDIHYAPFPGDEPYDNTMPQETFHPINPPYESTSGPLYAQTPDFTNPSASMHIARNNTPWSTSESSAYSPPDYTPNSSPELCYAPPPAHHRTISMTDVQPCADGISDTAFSVERAIYKSPEYTSFEPYPPIVPTTQSSSESPLTEEDPRSQDSDSDYIDKKNTSNRRSAARPRATTRREQNRTPKSSAKRRRRTDNQLEQASSSDSSTGERTHERPFYCPLTPYGCRSTFGAKNEWKRHSSTQHMRLGFWKCDKCPANEGKKSNNFNRIFNRKDLFMQHVRRMHTNQKHDHQQSNAARKTGKQAKKDSADQVAIDAAIRCHKQVRTPPTKSMCVVCKESFNGSSSWDKMMEHMGRHFEAARRGVEHDLNALYVDQWHVDNVFENWMIQHGILIRTDDRSIVIADESTKD